MIVRAGNDDYVFVARPHTPIDSEAGLFWYKLEKNTAMENILFRFETTKVTVSTKRFIKAVSVNHFRLFFSQQFVTNEYKYVSRVAQICQKTDVDATRNTYMDMPLECGDFGQLEVVEYIRQSNLFVAAFSRGSDAAICLYNFKDIQDKLVENVKQCYENKLNLTYDYLWYPRRPCKQGPVIDQSVLNNNMDYFLCGSLSTFKDVIGNMALSRTPILEYSDTTITALAAIEAEQIQVIIGTAKGNILKAILVPKGKKLQFGYTVDRGYPLRSDLVVSGKFVYALTENALTKVPVEMCARYKSCSECMESMDPLCRWCMFDNRCTSVEDCKSPARIAVSGNVSSCPHVLSVEPSVLSTRNPQQLILLLSHKLSGFNVTCRFMATENISEIRLGEVNDHSVKCLSPNFNQKPVALEGESNISIQLLTPVSSLPVMEGNFTVYNCFNFKSCQKCTMDRWGCQWCSLEVRCVGRAEQCPLLMGSNSNSQGIVHKNACPVVTNYTVVNDTVTGSSTTTMFLSVQQVYRVQVTGGNFIAPSPGTNYSCSLLTQDPNNPIVFPAQYLNMSHIECTINQMSFVPPHRISVAMNSVILDGVVMEVVFYRCEDLNTNCKQCESLHKYQPYFRCRWCTDECRHQLEARKCGHTMCPQPTIQRVYPISAHVNVSLCLDIEGVNLPTSYEEANNSVTVGGMSCYFHRNASHCNSSYVGNRLSCKLVFNAGQQITANISLKMPNFNKVTFNQPFTFRLPEIYDVQPKFGPISGRTNITIEGKHFLTGRHQSILLGGNECTHINKLNDTHFSCHTAAVSAEANVTLEFIVDDQSVKNLSVNFSYVSDPVISRIHPMTSFISGGRQLTVIGTNLLAVMQPMIVGYWNNGTNEYTVGRAPCLRAKQNFRSRKLNGKLVCPSPPLDQRVYQSRSRTTRSMKPEYFISLGFIMDGSVVHLPPAIGDILYYPDPTLDHFGVIHYPTANDTLEIKGDNLMYAANKTDVEVIIGCLPCNVTDMGHTYIRCNLPSLRPLCRNPENLTIQVLVKIGFLVKVVGHIQYPIIEPADIPEHSHTSVYIGGAVGGAVLFCLVLLLIIYIIRIKGNVRQLLTKERQSYEYKMDKMEGKFRNQCREDEDSWKPREFAALQTAMDDLTSDLEGGNVLFRDYSEYACRTLLTADRSRCLLAPPTNLTEKVEREMEQLKNLFRSRQFLLLFIRTLEKQNSFTIQDRSDVATFLMVINHDNMEYITGILTSLLNDLIDKNVTSNTPKLLLRRSESIGEKLLTYWLSIGLYHYLKEQTGSELFILYKAIKIQVEKGPVDYITACAKYTLSEDKLFTDTDTEDPKQLRLNVSHFDYLENKQKHIEVTVLDCDTITQAKSKMLEILYKNVGYSMRPPVHTTVLEVTMRNGSKLDLHDEDHTSFKEGLWRRINTMRHFDIPDGANASLYFNREDLTSSITRKSAEEPDAYIVGSIRESKPVARTVSGASLWHMMKQNQDDDEVRLATDLFLPRLIQTKGTLQVYIDNFYSAILKVSAEPPIIVKYLFDFLETAAARCSITDPEVLHVEILLLRFWVNVIKNPEFVFDIHKPVIVDSCLSVVAQTLMDSCSTSDLKLDANSPSNKLLFAKDIPRYKKMVAEYFSEMKSRPVVSDQELNSFLTQEVSQKYGSKLHQSTALHEMYKFVNRYRDKLSAEMNNEEAEHPGTFSALSSRLQCIYMSMDQLTGAGAY